MKVKNRTSRRMMPGFDGRMTQLPPLQRSQDLSMHQQFNTDSQEMAEDMHEDEL